jgi:hypothetical protein
MSFVLSWCKSVLKYEGIMTTGKKPYLFVTTTSGNNYSFMSELGVVYKECN